MAGKLESHSNEIDNNNKVSRGKRKECFLLYIIIIVRVLYNLKREKKERFIQVCNDFTLLDEENILLLVFFFNKIANPLFSSFYTIKNMVHLFVESQVKKLKHSLCNNKYMFFLITAYRKALPFTRPNSENETLKT